VTRCLPDVCQGLPEAIIGRRNLVRTVIDLPEEQATRLDAHEADDDAFGIWRERDLDGLKYERKARSEWT